MPTYSVIVNDCAAPPIIGLTHIRTRATPHGQRTFEFDYGRLVEGLPTALTPQQQDWADVMTFLYAIDLACPRGEDTDWQRRISAWVPVRDAPLWNGLATDVARIFGSLTYDHLDLTFVQDADPLPPPRQTKKALPAASCVALLSGGVDSYVGAAKLLDDGETPLLITHKNSGAAGSAVEAITPSLQQRGAPASPITMTARRKSGSGEGTQRARTMLYMGLACLVATAHTSGQVWLNENGVMAVHVPLTEARFGSFSTRTASPYVVERFAQLASNALGFNVTIQNSLIRLTKPEVVEMGRDLGLAPELADTVSCWSIGRSNSHCGRCTPCLVRQVSFEWAAVSDCAYDHYPMNALPSGEQGDGALDNLAHMAQLAVDLRDAEEEDLLLEYTELLDIGLGLSVAENIEMHRRWGSQFLNMAATHPVSMGLV